MEEPLAEPVQVRMAVVAMVMMVLMVLTVKVLMVFKPVVLVVGVVAESCIQYWQSHSPPTHLEPFQIKQLHKSEQPQ